MIRSLHKEIIRPHRGQTRRHASQQSFVSRVNQQMKAESPDKYEQYEKGRTQALQKMKKLMQEEEERVKNIGRWWVRPAAVSSVSQSSLTLDNRRNSSSRDSSVQTDTRRSNTTQPTVSSIFSIIDANIASLDSGKSDLSSMLAPRKEQQLSSVKKTPNRTMLYNRTHYETYSEIMEVVMNSESVQKLIPKMKKEGIHPKIMDVVQQWLLSEERIVETNVVEDRWKKFDEIWRKGWREGASTIFEGNQLTSGRSMDGEEFHQSKVLSELTIQHHLFLDKLLSNHYPDLVTSLSSEYNDEQMAKRVISQQFQLASTRLIASLLRYCAKRSRSDPMHVTWYKVKESGLKLPQESVSTFLYVVATMGTGFGSSVFRSDDEKDEEVNIYLVPEEVATFHDLLCRPTESSISLRVKTLAEKGDTQTAEELLEAFKKSIEDGNLEELIRLRTYIPVFKNYCDDGNASKALAVFHQMKNTRGVILEPENYCMLIATLAENGYFCDSASPIEGAHSLGYNTSHGPQLFDEIAKDMAEHVLEISSASARRLSNALVVGFMNANEPTSAQGDPLDEIVTSIKEAHPLAPMTLNRQPAAVNELVASKVSLDRSTGVCEVTASQQQLILLKSDQRKQFHDDLIDLSSTQYTHFTKEIGVHDKHAARDSKNKAAEQLQIFSDWLNTREGEPFTAIVDGANVGYYMQNFDKGGFSYHQIKFMVDTLESRGEKPLVVLPNKYNQTNYVYTSKNQYQRLSQSDVGIMKDLKHRDMLYTVPPRCLDDLYWMVASVSDQMVSRNDQDLSVPSHDPSGRFPGTRPMLITNDQMRDHRLELVEPRLFRRWYGCHIVNYSFTAFVMDESVAGNEIRFSQADFFSREIQGNVCPSSEESKWTGTAWHFPVSDWDLEERFVIRIPTVKQS